MPCVPKTIAGDVVVTTMYKLTVAVAVLCVTVFVPNHSYARDDGRFANSPLKEWFDRLASRNGLCCAFADGVSLQDVDWHHGDPSTSPTPKQKHFFNLSRNQA